MDNKLIQGLYCSKGNQEWKVLRIGVKIETFMDELIRLKSKASAKGFVNIDICTSPKDKTKMYAILDDYVPEKKPQVTSAEHSPDREKETDLPF